MLITLTFQECVDSSIVVSSQVFKCMICHTYRHNYIADWTFEGLRSLLIDQASSVLSM